MHRGDGGTVLTVMQIHEEKWNDLRGIFSQSLFLESTFMHFAEKKNLKIRLKRLLPRVERELNTSVVAQVKLNSSV